MKEIQLTQGYFALVDDEDFEELNKHKWHIKKHRNTVYAVRTQWIVGGKGKQIHYKMHRVILGLKNPKEVCDHINHNGLDNRKSNLRVCTNKENQKNRLSKKNSTSKYLGVSLSDNKWVSGISVNGKRKHLGTFDNTKDGEILAAISYDFAAIKYHGEFANLNFKE